jgi:hypothetical protein
MKQIGDTKMFSILDLAESTGLTTRTIRGWFMAGKLKGKGVKLGKEWFISEDNLKRFLNAAEQGVRGKPETTRNTRKRGNGCDWQHT